jgi:hypothetical protein
VAQDLIQAFDRIDDEPKDPATYPQYDETLKDAIRQESDRFIQRVLWEGDGTLASFFTSNVSVVNDSLAALYGVSTAGSGGWREITLNPAERAGWLTRANILAATAHQLDGSPPLRSVFILEKFFCATPPLPPTMRT